MISLPIYSQKSLFWGIPFHAVKDCILLTEDEKRFYVSLIFTE